MRFVNGWTHQAIEVLRRLSPIPPQGYHAIRNASDKDVAVSIHIYAEPMTCCGLFSEAAEQGDGWHRYIEKQLALDVAA